MRCCTASSKRPSSTIQKRLACRPSTTVSATSESGVICTGVPAASCISIHICILLVVSMGASGANSGGRSAAAQMPVSRIPCVLPDGNSTDTPMSEPTSRS